MTEWNELVDMDATAQAELVRKKEVKPIELVEATVERIEKLNSTLNAVVTPMYEQARKQASGSISDGSFAGVPFLLKDFLAEYAGVRFTEGTSFLGDYVPKEDSELIRRYKSAGLIFVGKTNTPEMAIGVTTEPRLFGPTRNPWDADRTPGGSSGGAAAAVASGMVPMAHGNDAGGSIRIPASCCGVFGLKPTRARNPLGPHYGDMFTGLVAEHVLTRSVRDSAAILDVTSGADIGDPYWAPPPARAFIQEVGAPAGKIRIAFSTRAPLGSEVHPDCVEAVRDAAALCNELGHEVQEATPAYEAELMWQSFTTILSAGFGWAVADWSRRIGRIPTSEFFEPFVWSFMQKGRAIKSVGRITLWPCRTCKNRPEISHGFLSTMIFG
jgi:amidase